MNKVLTKINTIRVTSIKKFKSLSRKKKIAVIITTIVIVLVIGNGLTQSRNPEYITAKTARSNITESITETGQVATNGITTVYSPTNGIVTEVYVTNGDNVAKDQDLFVVESTASEQEQQAAYASYLAAKTALDDATSAMHTLRATMYKEWDEFYGLATGDTYETTDTNPKTNERLDPEFQISQDEWVASEKQYKDQQTAVNQAQANVASTWLLYQATQNATVKSPISGVISNLAITSGSAVAIQPVTLTSPGKPAVAIVKDTPTEVVVSLSETDITKVRTGQEVIVSLNNTSNKTYKGIVQRVDTIGTDTAGVIRYNVYIQITNRDTTLLSGMTVDIEIITKELKNVLSVPNAAVKPYQGGRGVRIVNPKTKEVTYLPVIIGIKGKERTQILKGLSENQEVVTSLSNEQLKRPGPFGN